ncbi:RidA family protein [Microbacterium sp. Clip185]|uniref:RidA family protein n=1 Tax=Microbacterium sp. Clip185 TaxID=3025663 RepID=UPI00236571D2|nr:Rid family hydrolase [Microbacterium sp. Clip185]WDG17798.1 Rid family hydrolase [Microbacterium sp. Clip185]
MSVELVTPEGMFRPVPYHHVAVATGSRLVSVAGQIDRDGDRGATSVGDLAGQVVQAFRNAARGLAGVGASFADAHRIRMYVTSWEPAKAEALLAGLARAQKELNLPEPLPPLSLLGVEALFEPDVLFEVEVDAVLE